MPDHPDHWLRHRLGRRGLMLLLMALTYALIGIGVLTRPDANVDDAYELAIPQVVRGVAWMATAALAAVFAFRRVPPENHEYRWFDGDGIGWMALYLMPFIRVTSYAGSYICWVASQIAAWLGVDGGDWLTGGTSTAWYLSLLHLPFILIVLICSGWRENTQPLAQAVR